MEAIVTTAPQTVSVRNHAGDLPLHIAIRNKIPVENGLDLLLSATTVRQRCQQTGLYPFQLAAAVGAGGKTTAVNTIYHLLLTMPDLLTTTTTNHHA